MTYQPAIPIGGYAGWTFLQRTREVQQAAFDASPAIKRDVTYFRDNIASVGTASDLMADRRLLRVALGAFGLEEDINNSYFVQKILEDGTLDPEALANRLADKRYLDFAKTFGFGDNAIPRTSLTGFADQITDAFKSNGFAVAVGNVDPNMRLALELDESLGAIADRETTDNGRWYMVMGQPPLRTVFETATGLPATVGVLGLERQLDEFRSKTAAIFGDGEVSQFADPEKREDLVRMFLLRAESRVSVNSSGASAALTLLQSAGSVNGLLSTIRLG